jgi:ABC-type lipoprotein release transport system permease subunit
MRNTSSSPKSHRLLERVALALAAVSTLLGVATLIVVYQVMAGFRDDLMQRPGAAHDPALLEAIACESNVTLLMMAAIVLVAALYIVSGFLMIRRSQSGSPRQGA